MAYDTTRLAQLSAERAKIMKRLAAIEPEWRAEIAAADEDPNIGTVEIARIAGITRDAVRQARIARRKLRKES